MDVNDLFHALSDPMRRRILERLRKGPKPLGELAKGLPVSRPAVSQHVKVLEAAGLIRGRKDGRRRIYAIDLAGFVKVRAYLESYWDDVLAAFEKAANQENES